MEIVPGNKPARFRVKGYLTAQPTEDGQTALAFVWDVYDSTKQRAQRVQGESIGKRSGGSDPWAGIDQTIVAKAASDSMDAIERIRGWRDALGEHGLVAHELLPGDWSPDSAYAAGRHLLTETLTAVFCANDQMALGLMHALTEAGRSLPGQVSVVGFDVIPEAAHFSPPADHHAPGLCASGQGRDGADARCAQRLRHPNPLLRLPQLIERGSAAPPQRR